MRKIVLVFFLAFISSHLMAQKLNYDSLIRIALTPRYIIKTPTSPNRDSLFKLLLFTKSYPERIRLIFKIINNGLDFSKEKLTYHYKILQWAKTNNDKVSETVIRAELGLNSYRNGDNTKGLQIIFDALKLAEKTGNKQAMGIVYQSLASCYFYNIKLYKSYTLKALQLSEAAHDDLYTINAMQGLGRVYYLQNQPDSGKHYFFKALELSVRINALEYTCATLSYIITQENNETLKYKYYRARVALAIASSNAGTISHAFDGLSDYYLRHHQSDSGLFYARKAYDYSGNLSLVSKIRPAHLLSLLFDGRNADSALKYTKMYNRLHDSTNNIRKMQDAQTLAFEEQQRKQEAVKQKQDYQTRQRVYVLIIVIVFLLLLALIFWRNNRRNERAKKRIQHTLDELKKAQAQLIQSEKMASLGELTAGIAHEIQNPLNFVNNFSEVNQEMIDELAEELKAGNIDEALAIAADIKQNEEKINHHGKRADAIVKGMLQHSRSNAGEKQPTNLNAIADEFFKLSYHGLRAKDKTFNAELVANFDDSLPMINAIPQDIGRVMLNLFNNAFYAVNQKAKTAGPDYKPTVTVATAAEKGQVIIRVKDNGVGMSDHVTDKIMQPFFTTKPTGEGTGLGLSLTYDMVVKGHGGTIHVDSVENEFSEFTICLPVT